MLNNLQKLMAISKQNQQALRIKELSLTAKKLKEYSEILSVINLDDLKDKKQQCHLSLNYQQEGRILCSSHIHPLKRHPKKHHNGWRCDKMKGVNRCLSGITEFYQVDCVSPAVVGYRCD